MPSMKCRHNFKVKSVKVQIDLQHWSLIKRGVADVDSSEPLLEVLDAHVELPVAVAGQLELFLHLLCRYKVIMHSMTIERKTVDTERSLLTT